MLSKFKSRKFWMAAASLLASVSSWIAGLATANETLVTGGLICSALSAGIYAASEAFVDGMAASSSTTVTSVAATTTNAKIVESMLAGDAGKDTSKEPAKTSGAE